MIHIEIKVLNTIDDKELIKHNQQDQKIINKSSKMAR